MEKGALVHGISIKGGCVGSNNYLEEEKIRDFYSYLPVCRLIIAKKISKYAQQVKFFIHCFYLFL